MSGICGLFNLDDAPVTESDMRTMTATLEQRGPERTGRWRAGSVGFGHTLLATTPELQFERQPLAHPGTGCVITADVRLDNREELIGALKMRRHRETIGDAELILEAYSRWGVGTPERLLGDFAFAVWNPREKSLFCARDHFGMRPLYYHFASGKRFAIASDPKAILALSQVPYRINKGRIADFLVPELEWIDYTSTFFEELYRLPPGNKAIVSGGRLVVEEYWRPAPGPEPGPMSDDDYREGFLDLLTRAVECRLRAPPGSVGSMLSGGVDSGSVVAIAKEIHAQHGGNPFPTFSAARRRGVDCAESRAIRTAVTMPSIAPTFTYVETIGEAFDAMMSGNAEPFDSEAMILKAIYRSARSRGQHVVLDGAGGDVVLGAGSFIVRLLRGGHILQGAKEIRGEDRFWGGGMFPFNGIGYLRAAFTPEILKKPLRGILDRRRVKGYLKQSLIAPDFAASIGIEEHFERMREIFPAGWTREYASERCQVIRPSVTAGRERYERIAAAHAVEARDPFLDKRLVEFCARLPGRLRMRNGWPKIILRDAMARRLPAEVLWARGKPHLGWIFNAAVTREAVRQDLLSLRGLQADLSAYVDSAALVNAWHAFHSGSNTEPLHSAHALSTWLRENVRRPVVLDPGIR